MITREETSMIAKEIVYVVTHDDPFAEDFRQYCSKENGWEVRYDTAETIYKRRVIVALNEEGK